MRTVSDPDVPTLITITDVLQTSVTLNWKFGGTAVVNRSVVFYVNVKSSSSSWNSTFNTNNTQTRLTLTGLTPGHTYVFYLEIHSFDKTARSVNSTVTTFTDCELLLSHRLWLPKFQRLHAERKHRLGNPTRRSIDASGPPLQQPPQLTSTSACIRNLLLFGLLNIRSVGKKIDDLLDVHRDHGIGVQCLTETWHDDDCAAFSRLRLAGYSIVDRPRPRTSTANLDLTNHGGVAVIARPGVHLAPLTTVIDTPATFEFVCARVAVSQFRAIVAVVYRPGSDAVEQRFFDELSNLLDAVASFQEPVFVVGDFNVRLERVVDPDTRQLNELLASRGLIARPTASTHRDGGTIDAVVVREDMLNDAGDSSLGGLDVSVLDVGLSDHHLLSWSVNTRQSQQRQPLQTIVSRPWRSLDVERLRSELLASPLCQVDRWPSGVDEMAAMYDDAMTLRRTAP